MSVLVAYDDSDPARDAVEYAFRTHADETIHVVHVVDPADPDAVDEMVLPRVEDYRESVREQARALLAAVADLPGAEGVDFETEVLVGDPGREVVAAAREKNVDHVVVGSHGRTGATRVLLGSVAETVARRSPVPVTIVR